MARKTRLSGLILAILGALFLVIGQKAEDPTAWRLIAIIALAAGWGLLIFAMMRRALHLHLGAASPDRESQR